MPEADNVKLLKIAIGTDKKLRVTHTLDENPGALDAEIRVSPLQRDTINAFVKILREGRLLQEDEFRALGANLYDILLNNGIGRLITRIVSERYGFKDQSAGLLRIELEFEEKRNESNEEIRELLSWPWEYLYCTHLGRGMFLSETTQLILTRRLYLGEGERELLIGEQETPRVLFVSASPKGLERVQSETILEVFESEPVKDRIELLQPLLVTEYDEETLEQDDEEHESGRPSLSRMPKANWQAFKNVVASKRPHIIHFVGHGRFKDGKGEIAFVSPNYEAHWISEELLARELMGIKELRLVFLQACESGKVDKIADTGPYRAISGVASSLAANNIPAIVAMQYKVGQGISNAFTKEFYTALISSRAIEAAIIQGRTQILENLTGWSISRAFGLPVLYLRDPGSHSRNPGILLAPKSSQSQLSTANPLTQTVSPPASTPNVGVPKPGKCPSCNTTYKIGEKGCKNCGLSFFCRNCQSLIISLLEDEANFCTYCSPPTRIEKPSPLRVSATQDNYQATVRTGPL